MERYPGRREPSNTRGSFHTTPFTQIYWQGKPPGGWLLCSGDRQHRTKKKTELYRDFSFSSGECIWVGGIFQGEAFQALDWWDFKSRAWAFTLQCGGCWVQPLGQLECSVSGSWRSSRERPGHLCALRDLQKVHWNPSV